MPSITFNNPLKSLDLTKVDLRNVVTPATKIARDAAYVAVGIGVIATQRINARRYDLRQRIGSLQERINEAAPRIRDEAQTTAQRFIDDARKNVRSVVERRKHAGAETTTTVA
jgi:hypothetical protein